MATFLSNTIIKDLVLPFVLLFALIFAILEKSNILGKDKHQINAILAFVIAAIAVTFSTQVTWLQDFAVFLAVAIFILFIFMLLYSFSYGTTDGDPFKDNEKLKWILGAISFVAVIVAVLVITDTWNKVIEFFTTGDVGANVIMFVIIIAAIFAVLYNGKPKGDKKPEGK
jgi:heme/copper-type cytochrome/quinol oxidase subunit 2